MVEAASRGRRLISFAQLEDAAMHVADGKGFPGFRHAGLPPFLSLPARAVVRFFGLNMPQHGAIVARGIRLTPVLINLKESLLKAEVEVDGGFATVQARGHDFDDVIVRFFGETLKEGVDTLFLAAVAGFSGPGRARRE